MREKLARMDGVRRRFQGVFVRCGTKSGYKGVLTTILLKDVTLVGSGQIVTDHIWFTMGKRFERLDLQEGDVVRFDARVSEYLKGYRGRRRYDDWNESKPLEYDYRLSYPTKLVKVSAGKVKRIKVKGHYRLVERDERGRFKEVKKWSSKSKAKEEQQR